MEFVSKSCKTSQKIYDLPIRGRTCRQSIFQGYDAPMPPLMTVLPFFLMKVLCNSSCLSTFSMFLMSMRKDHTFLARWVHEANEVFQGETDCRLAKYFSRSCSLEKNLREQFRSVFSDWKLAFIELKLLYWSVRASSFFRFLTSPLAQHLDFFRDAGAYL